MISVEKLNLSIDNKLLKVNIERLTDAIGTNGTRSKEKIIVKCKICEYVWELCIKSATGNKNGCAKCKSVAKLSDQEVDIIINAKNIKKLKKYISNKHKIPFCCLICDYEWEAFPSNIMRIDRGCPKCSKRAPTSNKDVDNSLKGRSLIRLEDVKRGKDKIKFQCIDCKYIWETTPATIIYKKSKCIKCTRGLKINNCELDERLKDTNTKRLGDSKNNYNKLNFQCINCDYIWNSSPAMLFRGVECPSCSKKSGKKNERSIFDFLKDKNIIFEYQKSIKEINSVETKYCKIDFYIPNKNIIIEYNGAQHYEPIRFGGIELERAEQNFEKQIIRDQYIKDFCIKNNIELIIIDGRRYQNQKLEKYLKEELLKLV